MEGDIIEYYDQFSIPPTKQGRVKLDIRKIIVEKC